jgi:hypothetical protein
MAKKTATTSSSPTEGKTVLLDPFNGVLALFFMAMAIVVPDAFPAADGKLNTLHYLTLAVFSLLSAFFAWRWSRALVIKATRDEVEEDVARTRATTFSQPPTAKPAATTVTTSANESVPAPKAGASNTASSTTP